MNFVMTQKLTSISSQVTHEETAAKAAQLGIMFMETSAKAGHNVKSLFKKIAMSLPGMETGITPSPAEVTAQSGSHLRSALNHL